MGLTSLVKTANRDVCILSGIQKQESSPFRRGSSINKLANFTPLSPLTGDSSEWVDVGTFHDKNGCEIKLFQNKRCSSVFKDSKDSRAYDINLDDPDDAEKKYISFPYTPSY